MLKLISNSAGFVRCTLCVLLAVLSGCASRGSDLVDNLDLATGVTIASVNTPLLLYRDTPARAAHARDLAQLGPIEVNRSGNYRYFLWVGSWATMKPLNPSGQLDDFASIIIFADGEPLLLELVGMTPSSIGASASPYAHSVASSREAYYSVTIDQIRLIAGASDIRLQTTGPVPKEFTLWDGQNSARRELTAFLQASIL